MPKTWELNIDDEARARRHVLSQRMYRLRRRYRYLHDSGLVENARRVHLQLDSLSREYESIGGLPVHRGNVL